MKKTIFTLLILFFVTIMTYAQEGLLSDEKFFYEIGGLVYVKPYDTSTKIDINTKDKIPKESLQFRIVSIQMDPVVSTYYVIQFPFLNDKKKSKAIANLTDSNNYVIAKDSNNYFWISKNEYDKYTEENNLGVNCIFKSYRRIPIFTYGGKVSLPFKVRTKVNDKNVKIETNISLGGFAGWKCRLSRTKKIYTSAIISGGIISLPINNDNVSGTQNVEEGTILGLTYSLGLIVEVNDFDFGFFWGFDRASGEIGKYWIYNNMPWLSFTVGYTLFKDTSN